MGVENGPFEGYLNKDLMREASMKSPWFVSVACSLMVRSSAFLRRVILIVAGLFLLSFSVDSLDAFVMNHWRATAIFLLAVARLLAAATSRKKAGASGRGRSSDPNVRNWVENRHPRCDLHPGN
jgi:hypothetical protein